MWYIVVFRCLLGPAPTGTGTMALDPTFGRFTLLKPVSHYVNRFLWWKCLDCLDWNRLFWCSECGASNISTSKFCPLPMLQNWRTRERGQLILGGQNMTRLRTVWNTGDSFLPKNIDEFCMNLCRVTLDDQFRPSISSSSQLGYLFHIIHIDAFYLPYYFYCQ
jgi:hypothetical protein